MKEFLEALRVQRWDDHRYYHHSRINQSLHLVSALSFIVAYGLLFVDPAAAALLAWGVSMTTRQAGHFFFEPRGYDHVNRATHEHKEAIKVGYNLRRKLVLMSAWAAARLGLPVVSDFRTNFHAYSSHYGVAWLRRPIMGYLRHFHNRTAATMVPTDALRGELAAVGFERLRVVSRGVDTALFDPARRSEALRASWGVAPHGPVVLYVGRLALEKNLGDLLAAFEAVRGVTPGACLVLVGDGPERASLQRRCPDAVFAGVRRGGDLAAHYASADLFLFPSLTETFGNVVPEAMASGLALVAYDCAAAAQLVRHAENGLIVRSGESRGFCAAAACLAANPPAARAMGVRARATARRLDWESIVQAIETEYLVAMAKGMARDRAAELWLRRRTLPPADCHQTATRRTQTQAGTVIDETEESAQLG